VAFRLSFVPPLEVSFPDDGSMLNVRSLKKVIVFAEIKLKTKSHISIPLFSFIVDKDLFKGHFAIVIEKLDFLQCMKDGNFCMTSDL